MFHNIEMKIIEEAEVLFLFHCKIMKIFFILFQADDFLSM
jgi:hypothetical protein